MTAKQMPRTLARLWALSVGLVLAISTAVAAAPLEKLQIVTASGRHAFNVEVMRTTRDRAHGLMFRKTMPSDRGMLFDFERTQPVYFWMKNTILPLDMVFIDGRGVVVNVAENTVPMSEKVIPSSGPVLGVLEVNAGTAKSIGLKAGDKVVNPMFKNN